MGLNVFLIMSICMVGCISVFAYVPSNSEEPPEVTDSSSDYDDGGGYTMGQLNIGSAQVLQQQLYRQEHKKPIGAHLPTSLTTSATEAISATTGGKPLQPTLQATYVYSAHVPQHIEPEAYKVINAVKLASSTAGAPLSSSSATSLHTGYTNTYQSVHHIENLKQESDFSKNPIGSSIPSSVSVILNGDKPEFTDALGQKVPKPQPSLQVASPIDLLNPDRYEFYTFDDNGELVKRLMTMEEIQSIVANGDGEGPTIIHHGHMDDRDPEKNVQDIVNSVQDVLNKEVESNKNSTSNKLQILDTPDVSSSWSMILPAIFGNTGGVDILPQQKPQQIVMTPDTEIIETSTKTSASTSSKKPKPNRRKPDLKRKPTTTTEIMPQVIQEELDSHESVYTGMQQYHNLAAAMHSYDGFTQIHMQPIYQKLPEHLQIETTTKQVIINNLEVVKKTPVEDVKLNDNVGNKPLDVQSKPSAPHRVKKPNSGQTTTKRPQGSKQKIKGKPAISSTTEATTSAESIITTSRPITTTISSAEAVVTSKTTTTESGVTTPIEISVPLSTTLATKKKPKPSHPIHTTADSNSFSITPHHKITLDQTTPKPVGTTSRPIITTPIDVTESPLTTVTKKKKKKPIHTSDDYSIIPHLTVEKKKPLPHRPRPIQHTVSSLDLTAEGSTHQEVAQNKYQHVTYHKPRPKPQKPTTSIIKTTTNMPPTTVIFSPVPIEAISISQDSSLIVGDFPGYLPSNPIVSTQVTSEPTKLPTATANVPSTMGTSGYPVPIYGLPISSSEDSSMNQLKKQQLPSPVILQGVTTKPYINDIHTMQSFDQILQTLKIPDSPEKSNLQESNSNNTSFKPVKYESVENMDQLKEITNKHMIPMNSNTTAAIYTHLESNIISSTLTDLETTTVFPLFGTIEMDAPTTLPQNTITTDQTEDISTNLPFNGETEVLGTTSPIFVDNHTETSDGGTQTSDRLWDTFTEIVKMSKETTEVPLIQQDKLYDQEPQTLLYEINSETPINTTIVSTPLSDKTTVQGQSRLPVAAPQKEHNALMDDDEQNSYAQPILVADLKPQLNMEIIKPSSQITMSEFQTQAATVASTLVDGANTMAMEYNIMSSNETKDEIAFLMSDVIKQIASDVQSGTNAAQSMYPSHNYETGISKPAQEHYNYTYDSAQVNVDNTRYSNVAKLNTSFFMADHKQSMPQSSSLTDANEDNLGQKILFERLDDSSNADENIVNEKDKYSIEIAVTDISPNSTAQEQNTSKDYDIMNSSEESANVEDVTKHIQPQDLQAVEDYTTMTSQSNGDSEDNWTSLSSEEIESTTPLIAETTAFQDESTILDSLDNGDRETIFEADDSVDTTTQISRIFEETTETQWTTSSEEIVKMENVYVTSMSNNYSEVNREESAEDIQVTTNQPTYNIAEDEKFSSTEDNTASTEQITETLFNTTSNYEESTMDYVEQVLLNDSDVNDINSQNVTELSTERTINNVYQENANTESDKYPADKNITEIALPVEETIDDQLSHNEETTTIIYQMSEETSDELSAMISEEDETDEDPYIKLGETTTVQSIKPLSTSSNDYNKNDQEFFKTDSISNNENKGEAEGLNLNPNVSTFELESAESETQSITQAEENANVNGTSLDDTRPNTVDDGHMLAPPKPINITDDSSMPTGTHTEFKTSTEVQSFEGSDEEDEDDQGGYQIHKLPQVIINSSVTTTPRPSGITTKRLNTLKPVSYFNKQPAYALYKDTVEPLYNKHPTYTQPTQESLSNKLMTYSIPIPMQRPMQRPPQLSNLMIASTQATRPPVKLEPSPSSSKGLEASLTNLDPDILAFARLCNELAFSYWKSITAEKISSARSLVISPFALTSMLSMVFLGARGSTSGEMNDVLKLDDMVSFNPHLVFKNITDSVEKATDSDIATTAFVREVFSDRANGKILQFFKEKTQQLYAGHVEEVNFHVVNDIIRRRTNLLMKRHTMGKVLEYLRTNSVWVNGPLATISANLFQTDCSQGSTTERDGEIFFQVHPTVRQRRLIPIPAVLFKTGFTAGYEPSLEATVAAFGRIQDTVSIIYVMPGHQSSISPSDNLDRLEKELMETAISKNVWSNLLTSLMDRPGMEVQLPRFSHRSFVNATLGLQKMGLKGLFKSDNADLGGLTGSSNRDIYLSDMIQINTFSTCGEEKIADHHHVEMYPAPPLRKRNKDVDAHEDDDFDSSEAVIDFGSLVQDTALGRGFYDDLLDPKYLELPLPLRPRQARVPDTPRLRFDKPFLYFVRHNPTGIILFMGRFNPRLLP